MAITPEQLEWEEKAKEIPSEPVILESEAVFDSELLDSAGYSLPPVDSFPDDPLKLFASLVGDLKDMAKLPSLGILPEMPQSEHKVKIFRIDETMNPHEVCAEIEAMLNDGYCCHHPVVVNDYVIMDFSRRKETEEDERRNSANEAHEIQSGD